jgi:hypothetical protein
MGMPTGRSTRDRRAQPSIPPRQIARTTPEDGDIVVREEARDGALLYVLHTAPGADQHLLRSRREAVAHALASAKRESVRACRVLGNARIAPETRTSATAMQRRAGGVPDGARRARGRDVSVRDVGRTLRTSDGRCPRTASDARDADLNTEPRAPRFE